MPTVPISFVAAFLLVIMLVRLWRSEQGAPPVLFLILLGTYALASVVVGLRWSFQVEWARGLQPVLTAALPPLSWVVFVSMMGPLRAAHWVHASGVVVVLLLSIFWREPLDLVLIGLFLGYAVAMIRAARTCADRLEQVRLGEIGAAQRAVLWVGWMWVLSALVEAVIGLSFALEHGEYAPTLVTVATALELLAFGWIMAYLGGAQVQPPSTNRLVPDTEAQQEVPAATPSAKPSPSAIHAHHDVLAAFDRLMQEQRLFLDPNLTLDRMARRLGIPARQISAAINAVHARNVSQVVNQYRVAEAQRLLTSTARSVTEVLMDAGFQTKSNFNREFRRVAGMSPSDYRAQAGGVQIKAEP